MFRCQKGNEYGLPAGYYSFDREIDDNPTKVIYVGAGTMAIANSKKSNGDWNFRTFGTGDGFVADLLVAGMIRGGNVRWNLEDGTFIIGESVDSYSMYWDGSTLFLRNVDIDLSNNYQISEINDKIEENTNNFNNSIINLDDKLTGLSSSVDTRFTEAAEDTDSKIGELSGSFDTKISNITGEIESVRQDFKVGQGEFRSEINTKIKDLTADVEINFKDVNEKIAGNVTGIANLDSQIKQTESSITQSVSNQIKAVNDKISKESTGIRTYVQDNYSTKTQTADKISSEITSVKKLITDGDNSVKTYLQNNYSTATQTSTMIENKVSSINTRLGSAESRITQTNNKIESEIKSVRSDTADIISATNSRITQTDKKIESRVTSGEARSIFRQEAKSFTFDADQVNFNSNVNVRGTFETRGSTYNEGGESRVKLEHGRIKFWDEMNGNYAGRISAWNRSIEISAEDNLTVGANKFTMLLNGNGAMESIGNQTFWITNVSTKSIKVGGIDIAGTGGKLYLEYGNQLLELDFNTGSTQWYLR